MSNPKIKQIKVFILLDLNINLKQGECFMGDNYLKFNDVNFNYFTKESEFEAIKNLT